MPWSYPASIETMLKSTKRLLSLSIPPNPSAISCHSGDLSVSVLVVSVASKTPLRLSSFVRKCPPVYIGGVASPRDDHFASLYKLIGQTPAPNASTRSRRSSSSSLNSASICSAVEIFDLPRAALRARSRASRLCSSASVMGSGTAPWPFELAFPLAMTALRARRGRSVSFAAVVTHFTGLVKCIRVYEIDYYLLFRPLFGLNLQSF